MININLNTREKLLIYIFSILLIIFIYVNLIRGQITSDIESLNSDKIIIQDFENISHANKDISQKIENLSYVNIRETKQHQNFGSRVEISNLFKEYNLYLSSFSISEVKVEEIDSVEVSSIESVSTFEGIENDINAFLENIINTNYLYISDITLNRIKENSFSCSLRIKEYTTIEIPYTGIVYNDLNSNIAYEEQDLMSKLYGTIDTQNNSDKENIDSVDIKENSDQLNKTNKSSEQTLSAEKEKDNKAISDHELKPNKSTSPEKIIPENTPKETKSTDSTREVNKANNVLSQKTEQDMPTDTKKNKIENSKKIDIYKIIDENNKFLLEKERLDGENKDNLVLLNSEYIKDNLEFLKENSNINSIKDGEPLYLNINSTLDLSESSLNLDKMYDSIYFEANCPKHTMLTIYFLDDNYKLIPVDAIKEKDGYEVFILKLPKEFSYPVDIKSIIVQNSGDNYGEIRNIIVYN